jgi:uncharacterized membrane protein YozB (DUF420 family)
MSEQSPPAETSASTRPPRAYLGWVLFATIACFLPLGLVALYYGMRTNRAVADGRLDEANRDSRVTRRWLVATVVVGVVVYLFIGAVFALLGAFSS